MLLPSPTSPRTANASARPAPTAAASAPCAGSVTDSSCQDQPRASTSPCTTRPDGESWAPDRTEPTRRSTKRCAAPPSSAAGRTWWWPAPSATKRPSSVPSGPARLQTSSPTARAQRGRPWPGWPSRCSWRPACSPRGAVLIDNATVHADGDVRLSARRTGQGAVVADHGGAVLTPEQLYIRRNPQAAGHGIGLALAQRLAEAEDLTLVLGRVPRMLAAVAVHLPGA